MKRSARLAAVLASGPLAAAALLPASAAAAAQTIRFTAVQYHSSQKGKTISFQEHFISAGRTIGHDAVSCTQGTKTLSCVGTFYFTSGLLHVRATVGNGKVNHGIVVSGTGRYAGRKGTFTLTDVASNKTNIAISLT
jgi:hypothetical protein